MAETINREAGDKLKGTRLQKLRAVTLMLQAAQCSENAHIYCAIEHQSDVYLKKTSHSETTEHLEEDKNYDPDSRFTMNAIPVINTLVYFIDCWIEKDLNDKNVFFGFYTTSEIGKESITKSIKESSLELPDKPMLELLGEQRYDYKNLLNCVKFLIIEEYKRQYNDKNKGNIELIEGLKDDEWKKFLSLIDWQFGNQDEEALKVTILDQISAHKYFNHELSGKEHSIFCELLELFESRQSLKDKTERFVYGADIEIVFLKASINNGADKLDDPVWAMWEKMVQPTDKRNLQDKIVSVCTRYDENKLKLNTRIVGAGLIEKQAFEADKGFLSLRYRIFQHCEQHLHKYLESRASDNPGFTSNEIDTLLAELKQQAKECLKQLSQTYKYSFMNEKTIEGIIYELFDSCFLAFDNVG